MLGRCDASLKTDDWLVCLGTHLRKVVVIVVSKRSILVIRGHSCLSALETNTESLAGFRIETAADFKSAVRKLVESRFVGVLLDLVQPENDGLELLLCLRRNYRLPILVFAQTSQEADRIFAYEMGADDFLSALVSRRELAARVQSVISRATMTSLQHSERADLSFVQDLQIDVRSRRALKGGIVLQLTSLEFDLLAILIRRAGRVSSRESLLSAISDGDYSVLERTIDVHIASLRRKLGDESKNPKYIRTVRGIGYQMIDSDPVLLRGQVLSDG